MAKSKRLNWIDEDGDTTLIDDYAQKLDSFTDTFLDGKVDDDELAAQEKRVVDLMKKVEPQLDDETHAQITELLCEMTAYTFMQVCHELEQSRPKTQFIG